MLFLYFTCYQQDKQSSNIKQHTLRKNEKSIGIKSGFYADPFFLLKKRTITELVSSFLFQIQSLPYLRIPQKHGGMCFSRSTKIPLENQKIDFRRVFVHRPGES